MLPGGKFLEVSPFSPVATSSVRSSRTRSFTSESVLVPGKPQRSPSPRRGPRPRTTLPNPPSFYFDVSDEYVGTKLKMLFLPFLRLDWSPALDEADRPASPRLNPVSADLYIPALALTTYFLLLSVYGDQQLPGSVTFAAQSVASLLLLCIAEISLEWVGLYWLLIQPPQTLELFAYALYKVVPVLAIRVVTGLFGQEMHTAALLYFAIMHSLFICRSWRQFTSYGNFGSLHHEETIRRTGLLYIVSFAQILLIHMSTAN